MACFWDNVCKLAEECQTFQTILDFAAAIDYGAGSDD